MKYWNICNSSKVNFALYKMFYVHNLTIIAFYHDLKQPIHIKTITGQNYVCLLCFRSIVWEVESFKQLCKF